MRDGAATLTTPGGRRLGPIRLLPGVTPTHALIFLFANFFTIGWLVFVNITQTYLMNTKLGIPEAMQGTLSGDLAFWSEFTIIFMVWLFGMLSDHAGRRFVFAGGLAVLGASYIVYPMSTSADGLYISRLIYAVGVAAVTCMLTVITHDYPQEQSRGKLVVASGIFGGSGAALIGALGGAMPDFFIGRGATEIEAGYYMNWVAAGICIAIALIVAAFAHPGVPEVRREKPGFWDTLLAGLRAGRKPRIALLYFSAFAARADFVIAGTFLVLWGTLAGKSQGLAPAEAVAQGTILFVIFSAMSLVWAPVMGYLLDRFDRLNVLACGAALAMLGFASMGLIDDPIAASAKPYFILLGIGQATCFFASQALIGQEAPAQDRGTVIGAFSTCGAIGVLVAAGIGGRLFDELGPAAPFLMMAVATGLLSMGAVLVKWMERTARVSG